MRSRRCSRPPRARSSLHRAESSLFARAGLVGVVTAVLVASLIGAGGAVIPADSAAAAAGGDEVTSSAVTVTNKDDALAPEGAPFPELAVTVSQTKDLVSQGIRVSWTGGKQSERPSSTVGGTNFLQIAQCWGEDPENPGHPDRRTCQYGGTLGAGSYRDGTTEADDVATEDLKYTHVSSSFFSPTYTAIPFVAVNSVDDVDESTAPLDRVITNLKLDAAGKPVQKTGSEFVDLNTNQFFSAYSTNEVKWAGAGADGSGAVPFEVQTNMQSTALGCGAPLPQPDGTVVGRSCWLVIIPRGQGDSGSSEINRSGLWWDSWEHHLAVKLDFKPLGVRCQIGQAERQLAGSELVAGAIASWQPQLCSGENGSPFVLSQGNEGDALARAADTKPSPLAFTSRPLDIERIGGAPDPLSYAPVALAGLAISFSIDRQPHPQKATQEEKDRAGLPMTQLKLTPRLIAKLLTASYVDSLPDEADKSHIGYRSFEEPGKNPRTIVQDKEFQTINEPEWSKQIIIGASVADVLTPSGRSDLAYRLWEYVLSDPAAKAWLDGEPDENGMVVNPWYSTSAEVNPTHVGLTLPVEDFPKADPVEKVDTTQSDPSNGSGPINLVTWRPYTHSFADGAYHTLRGDGLILGQWDRNASPPKFGKPVRELFGSQKVIGLTTTPAAELYQTVTASLRNPAGEYVAPTREGLSAAAAAMTPTAAQSDVMEYAFTGATAKAATTAYPLAIPVYAALNPAQTDSQLRGVYSDLIRFAARDGQVPGTDLGDLPPGYSPIPQSWVIQALAAADEIQRGAIATTPPSASPTSLAASVPSSSARSQVPAIAPAAGAPLAAPPQVTGEAAGLLAGATTPADPETGPLAVAVPWGIAAGLASALTVVIIPRLRRRA